MQTVGKRLWNTGEKYCKELTDYHKKEKNKQLKTTLLGRNIRSRKWKVCRYSIHDISGEKADTASDPEQDVYLRSCHFLLFFLLLWVVFSSILCWEITSVSWEYVFNGISTTPSPVPTISTGKRTVKCQPFEKERFRNNELLHGDQTVRFFFPVYMCSPLTQRPKNSATA